MIKQSAAVTCVCGQAITFPEGEVKTQCACGAVWECGIEGYWYTEIPAWHTDKPVTPYAPILAKPKPVSVKTRKERYCNYPKAKRKKRKKQRKAGRKCLKQY